MTDTTADTMPPAGQSRLSDTLLAAASAVLAATAIIAVWRGRDHWGEVAPLVWVHLASIVVATTLTPVMLLRAKGNHRHRVRGYAWVVAMMLTAVTSLFFNARAPGGWGVFSGDLSPIHLLSLVVLIMVPRVVIYARAHNRRAHQRTVRGIVVGALLIAGFFTFPFDRMLGSWLFG